MLLGAAGVLSSTIVLVFCLVVLGINLLLSALLVVLPGLQGREIMVSNETGLGVVPMGELSRRYCDRIGLLHQQVAALSDRVILTVAGLPHYLKGAPD